MLKRLLDLFFSKNTYNPVDKTTDRRKAPRFAMNDLLKIDFIALASPQVSGIGDGKDISLSGMKIATFTPLKKGAKLDAALIFSSQFPGRKKIVLEVEVVRIYKPSGAPRFRMGVRFLESEKYRAEFEVIRQFVAWVESLQPGAG